MHVIMVQESAMTVCSQTTKPIRPSVRLLFGSECQARKRKNCSRQASERVSKYDTFATYLYVAPEGPYQQLATSYLLKRHLGYKRIEEEDNDHHDSDQVTEIEQKGITKEVPYSQGPMGQDGPTSMLLRI